MGFVTAGNDLVYAEQIHTYEERIGFKIDENYNDFVKGYKDDFEYSIQAQLASILQCAICVRNLEVFPGSFTVNVTLVGYNDMEADELKQSYADLIALLEAGALKLVIFLLRSFKRGPENCFDSTVPDFINCFCFGIPMGKTKIYCGQTKLVIEVKSVFKYIFL